MSRAYRKWKASIKAYRRGQLPRCQHDYIILLTDTSMAAYRMIRRVRQRELKRMKKSQKAMARIGRQIQPFDLEAYVNPYHQVSETERIRQANEYWRQSNDLH